MQLESEPILFCFVETRSRWVLKSLKCKKVMRLYPIFFKHQSFHQKEAIKANIYSAGKLRSAIYIGEVQKRCRALYTTWIWKRLPLLYWQATLTFGGLSTTAAFSCSFLSSSNNIGPGKTANFEYSAWLSQRTTRSRWKKTWKHSFTTWGKSHHHHQTFNTLRVVMRF